MILHHIPERSGVFVIAGPGAQAFLFTHGNLDVVDIFMIPDGFENTVGEAEHHNILHRFFPEIMIDTVDLRFIEYFTDRRIDGLGRLQIMADGFFYDDSGDAIRQVSRIDQPGVP